MKSYFYNSPTGLVKNVFQSIGTVIVHLYPKDPFYRKKKIENEYFRLVYNVRTICKSDECKKCGIQKAVEVDFTEGLNFNLELDHTVNINHMAVEEIMTCRRNIRRCSSCRLPLSEEIQIVRFPHVLTCQLTHRELAYDIDREIIVFGQCYELSSVIYLGDSHFVTRSMINGIVKEYDGKRSDLCYVLPNDIMQFPYRIIDFSMNERKAQTLLYRKV